VGCWDFNETSGQTVLDYSLTGNNGTLGADSSEAGDDPMRIISSAPIYPFCPYLLGDINGDDQRIGGDVTFGVRYLKGMGSQPPDSCANDSVATANHSLYVAADANGNCEFRGSDITRLVAFFKGNASLQNCRFFPPLIAAQIPVLTTAATSAITETTAICGGTIISDCGALVIARGVCWSADSMPTVANSKTSDGIGVGSFTSFITGLTDSTTYYIRAYATSSIGTGYGNTISFTTLGTVTDIDGNTYLTVKIGNQWWMAENLRVTHFRNGEDMPNITDNTTWRNLTTGAYCNYNNDTAQVAVYGRLYNWYAVGDSRNIAPAGWHVPSDAEWQTLVDYLGGQVVAGGKMKEVGTTHWWYPSGATNESGFTALPGGLRGNFGVYSSMGNYAQFWSSTENYSNLAWYHYLVCESSGVNRYDAEMRGGFSVRCVKDQ
jgi:uncharacterized protein (TIGR02145 family)